MSQLVQAIYLSGFFGAGIGCLWGAWRALDFDEGHIRHPLSIFFALTGLWALVTLPTFTTLSLEVMTIFHTIGLILGLAVVVVWLWFCSAYAGFAYHYDQRLQLIVGGLFGGIAAVKVTNPLHGLYFTPALVSDPFVHFAPVVGPVYWFVGALTYVVSAVGLYLLFDVYYSSRFDTTRVTILTVIIGLPVLPKLLALAWEETLLLVFYEPLGAAVFAVGILTVAREPFLAARTPARRRLVDRLSEAVVIVDSQDRLADYNTPATKIFPAIETSIGEALERVVPELAAHQGNKLLTVTVDSRQRHYRVISAPLNAGPTELGRGIVLSDVTELEAQRQRLQAQARRSEQLAEGIAHQLRNPLAMILAETQTRLVTVDGADETAEAEQRVVTLVRRMEAVINDLLSAIQYTTPVTETEPLAVDELVQAASKSITADTTVVCGVDSVIMGERIRCQELFTLLFEVHADRGATEIRVARRDDNVVVESDAEAFTTEQPERLFEYGEEAGEGERIRLANAQSLATLHGWTLTLDTDRTGLRFVIKQTHLQ